MKTAKPDKVQVISLADLAPRADVKGGAGVRVFGQAAIPEADPAQSGRPAVARPAISRKRPGTRR